VWTVVGDEIFVRVRKKGGEDPLSKLIGVFPTKTKVDATAEIDATLSELYCFDRGRNNSLPRRPRKGAEQRFDC